MRLNRSKLARAAQWKRERLAQLDAEIQIQYALWRNLERERYELQSLHGRELQMRFDWESPAEVDSAMRPSREFIAELEEIFLESEMQRLSNSACA